MNLVSSSVVHNLSFPQTSWKSIHNFFSYPVQGQMAVKTVPAVSSYKRNYGEHSQMLIHVCKTNLKACVQNTHTWTVSTGPDPGQ